MRFGIFSVADHYPAERPRTSARFTNFGGLEHGKVLRSMELMARHVISAFA